MIIIPILNSTFLFKIIVLSTIMTNTINITTTNNNNNNNNNNNDNTNDNDNHKGWLSRPFRPFRPFSVLLVLPFHRFGITLV